MRKVTFNRTAYESSRRRVAEIHAEEMRKYELCANWDFALLLIGLLLSTAIGFGFCAVQSTPHTPQAIEVAHFIIGFTFGIGISLATLFPIGTVAHAIINRD